MFCLQSRHKALEGLQLDDRDCSQCQPAFTSDVKTVSCVLMAISQFKSWNYNP